MPPLAEAIFLDLGEAEHLVRVFVRLLVALVLGGLLGLERQQEGKAAGVRTHMLVALGAALFIIVLVESQASAQVPPNEKLASLSRVIQGVVAGIGFLGAGTILKLGEQREIKGLTTAASIWLTAALCVAVGACWLWPAVIATVLALVVLALLHVAERWLKGRRLLRTTEAPVRPSGSGPDRATGES
jgi:putative Mg2+ transporter-C (MgtC) family protein